VTRALKNLAQIAVIGGGLAGLMAARQATRLGKLVTLFEGSGMYGGQVATAEEVYGLGIPGHFSGQDVAIHLLEEARKTGVRVIEWPIAALDIGAKLTLTAEDGVEYQPEAVIVASGTSARKLGIAGEEEFVGRGLSHCATCDGGFFRGQDVAVIGGGDAAVTEALVLARTRSTVHMICRSPLSAKREYIEKIDAKENVRFHWDTEATAILGSDSISGLALRNVRTGAASEVACAGLFPYIGGAPNSGFLPAKLTAKDGRVAVGSDFATADRRVFAVGAIRQGYGGNVSQAMAEGVSAAESAVRLIDGAVKRSKIAA
jgi:thioredoxin reductase (NADPH)